MPKRGAGVSDRRGLHESFHKLSTSAGAADGVAEMARRPESLLMSMKMVEKGVHSLAHQTCHIAPHHTGVLSSHRSMIIAYSFHGAH